MFPTKIWHVLCGCIFLSLVPLVVYFDSRGTKGEDADKKDEQRTFLGESQSPSSQSTADVRPIQEDQGKEPVVGEEPDSSGRAGLSAEQRMEEQLRLAASVFEIDLQEKFSRDEITSPPLSRKLRRSVYTPDGKCLSFDVDTGQLLTFDWAKSEDVPESLSKKDAISREQAMEKVKGLLHTLGTGENLEIDRVYFRDSPISPEPGHDRGLIDAVWTMEGHLSYNGIGCSGTGMRIEISAWSGKVLLYYYMPPRSLPTTMNEEKIEAAQALEIGREFLENYYGRPFSTSEFEEPVRRLTSKNNCWTRNRGEMIQWENDALLCWVVCVKDKDETGWSWPPSVYINATTGEVCGGVN